MAENDISDKKELFAGLLRGGRLHEAIAMLKGLSERNMLWEVTDRINRVEESYGLMLRYALDGVVDPQREVIYNNIKNDLLMIYDRLTRLVRSRGGGSVYYTTIRSGQVRSVADAVSRYRGVLQSNDAFSLASGTGQGATVAEMEAVENALFESVWVSFPYSADDESLITGLLSDGSVPSHVKVMVISALMLGSFEFFDARRAMALANTYGAEDMDEQVAMTALTALLIMLYVNRGKELTPELTGRIAMLRDKPSWRSDVKTVFMELIRTRDTERIANKLRDEIVPEMIKIKPELDKRMRDSSGRGIDPADMEENPEWQEFLESSGIADRVKELTELQEEGGDVLMATFAQLKSFPFFYAPANWFRPFVAECSAVAQLGDDTEVVGEMIAQAPFMCDSDKYSFVLAFATVPEAQRSMMISQIKAQNVNAAELRSASLNLSADTRRNVVNKYVQNLYRFFRLFRRRDDFVNPFASEINLTEVKPLQADFLDEATLRLVGEFYFKHKYYSEACGVFKLLETHTFPDATLYQKIGYCEQQLGNLERAVEYYDQSELLTANSAWTTKRLAVAHRQLGHFDKALDYYRRLDGMQPDRFATAMSIGQCLMALERYDEAAKAFYKASYLDEASEKPLRPLAWCLLMQGDTAGADRIYSRLPEESAQPLDSLNRGHVALVEGDYRRAIGCYRRYVGSAKGGWGDFLREMGDDSRQLVRLGVDRTMLPLVIDGVRACD